MHTCMCTDSRHWTIAQLSGPKPMMLVSSVQAVGAGNATVLRVCTLVLFICMVFGTAIPLSLYIFGKCFSYLFVCFFAVPQYTTGRCPTQS